MLASPQARATPGQSLEEARHHWAYQPITSPTPPRVRNQTLVRSPIDAFLLSKLEEKGLTLSPPSDKRTLLRRVYYDLIGLPPTFEEIESFERDHSSQAFEKVVDRLLASPRYGERWGRHWLDVARYADTKDLVLSYGKDALRPYAYTYRDYVIRAFNQDLPFNQFVQDQLAADLVQPPEPKWRLAALGFLTLGRLFDNNPHDQIDDQIDTTTRGFLAMTVACARCHDHKYDAIFQKDYYALYGVFASTERPYELPLLEDPNTVPGGPAFEKELAKARHELESHIDSEFTRLTENFRLRIGDYLVRAATTKPDITETAQFALSLAPEDFRPALVQRTRRLLEQRVNPEDRVFGPWSQLSDQLQAGPARLAAITNQSHYNPLVLEALEKTANRSADNSPRSIGVLVRSNAQPAQRTLDFTNMATIASAYGSLLLDVYQESKKPVAGNPNGPLSNDQRELLMLVTSEESPIWFPRRDTPEHMSRPEKDKYGSLVANLDKLAANANNPPPARAMIVADLPEPIEPQIFKRGNPSRLGEQVPREFIEVLSGGNPKPFTNGSGRLELAQAIIAPTNPLTARVFVNRVWMLHFGEPLVASTTDFGTRTETPLHRELLDWLASDFIRSGWSVKHLHRTILLSAAWQQSSGSELATHVSPLKLRLDQSGPASAATLDPENKLLWHFSRRRLDFEAMRDSLLFISGRLDLAMGGRPVDTATDPQCRRRSVYGLIDRQNLPGLFRAFDFPAPDQCLERRPRTSVPQQALFGMNSPFVLEQARALADRAAEFKTRNPSEEIDTLFRIVHGRHATTGEIADCRDFLSTAEPGANEADQLSPWDQLAQVLLISNESLFLD